MIKALIYKLTQFKDEARWKHKKCLINLESNTTNTREGTYQM